MSVAFTITIDGTDETSRVIASQFQCESQMLAVAGTISMLLKDPDQTFSCSTGSEVTVDLDGVRIFGGFITQVSRQHAFDVGDTVSIPIDEYAQREWLLRGVDYNILFDKLYARNTADYAHQLPGTFGGSSPNIPLGTQMGAALRNTYLPHYLDLPGDLDYTSLVQDVQPVNPDPHVPSAFMSQGTVWRNQMDDFAQFGAVYYINANKQLVFEAVEDTEATWQFSDRPNNLPIPDDYSYKPTIGFREVSSTEDATLIIDDVFVWGGSEWSNGLVFARRTNTDAISAHGRWQLAELHFGETDFKLQAGVNARANVLISGNAGGSVQNQINSRGYAFPQQTINLVWFDNNVPVDPNSAIKSYLEPGDLVTFIFYAFGTDAAHPQIIELPLRQLQISIPSLAADGTAIVRFSGFFGLQLSDPWWLWKYLRDKNAQIVNTPVQTETAPGGAPPYGTLGSFVPTPAPDGTTQSFTIPYGYITGTTEVYVNGLRWVLNVQYTESDPVNGVITFTTAPVVNDQLYVFARLSGV